MTRTKKIAKARGRSVTEWIGSTPDAVAPDRVRLRIFDRHNGICHITGKKIMPGDEWDADHIKRLEDGGENRERNLAPALRWAHRIKTGEETSQGKADDRKRKKHIGIIRRAKPILGSPMPTTERAAKRKANPKTPLPPRALYEDMR